MAPTRMKSTPMHDWTKMRKPEILCRLLLPAVALLCLLCSCTARPAKARPFGVYVLDAVRSMPTGGGYASDRVAELRLAQRGITRSSRGLRVAPRAAAPTFCSAACYMVLLQALQASDAAAALTPAAWNSLRVETEHPDGYLSWGRVNANGPGLAKWVQDLQAGFSFSSVSHARPGDFLKFFHTDEIGAGERGHMVVYLGTARIRGELCIHYWSSNAPGGFGTRYVPLRRIHHPIFTRITHPERLSKAAHLPLYDPWLASMQVSSYSYADVVQHCKIATPPEPAHAE